MFRFASRPKPTNYINRIHGDIVAATRQPTLYRKFGIADTFEGRFEVLTLHAAIVLRRLQQLPNPGPKQAQALADTLFAGLEAAMREMGVGDSVIPKRMGRLLEAFSGRMLAYGQSLETTGPNLAQTLQRNVLAGQGDATALCAYAQAFAENLECLDLLQIETTALPVPDPENFLGLTASTGQQP